MPPGLPKSNAEVFEAFEHFYFASICILASAQRETAWAERRDFERDWGMLCSPPPPPLPRLPAWTRYWTPRVRSESLFAIFFQGQAKNCQNHLFQPQNIDESLRSKGLQSQNTACSLWWVILDREWP